MTAFSQLLAFIAEIVQFINLFEAILLFLGFFGVTI